MRQPFAATIIACAILWPAWADMSKDSPVVFPKEGALPAKYPPDLPSRTNEATEEGDYIFRTPERSLSQIRRIEEEMPPGQFTVPPQDWTGLERTRRLLSEGGDLRLLALGDSIVNDTMRSGWVARLQEAYPKAKIHATVYVRGGGGCQHYRQEDRVGRHIIPRQPDLVFIGGISQRSVDDIREVIRQLRAGLPEVEVLLASGAFGTADPRYPQALAQAPHSGSGDYGRALQELARRERCAYLDMTTPWARYISSSGVHPHRFYRDVVHANEYGEQILSKILMAFFAGAAGKDSPTSKVVVYPSAPGLTTSDELAVQANGQAVWVEKLSSNFQVEDVPSWFLGPTHTQPPQQVNIAAFACKGPVKVRITAHSAIGDYVVRPRSRGIEAHCEGSTLEFSLAGPDKLYVEIEGLAPLCLFADPMEEGTPDSEDENVLYFGPGEHRPGVMTLRDGQMVYLAAGAVVYGAISGAPRGATVCGRGILDGQYKHRLVQLKAARDVRFEGVMLRNGRGWQNTLTECENVAYENVKVISFGNSGDGINPVGSRDVTIRHCFLRCTDDCIAIKSPGAGQTVERIAVLDSTLIGYAFADGVTIGFETNGPFVRDVLVRNCDILIARGGSRVDGHSAFSIICDGPARISNIRYEDLRVEQDVLKLFELHVTDGTKYQADPPGHIQGVHLKDIQWAADGPIILKGFDAEHRVEDVVFENCTVAGKRLTGLQNALFSVNEYVRGIRFE